VKSTERWRAAQRREVGVSWLRTSFTKDEKKQIIRGLARSDAYWDSYFEQRAGIKRAELSGKCVMEIGGVLFADQLLWQTACRHKLILDPLVVPRVSDDCGFVCGMAEHIPQKSSTLHFCWMTNTIDHCADPLAALQEIRRVLTEDGRLYITCNTFAAWAGPLFPAFDYLDGPHPHHFTRSSFLNLLVRAGFTVEAEVSPWRPPLRGWNRALGTVKVLLGRAFGLRQTQVRCCVARG
jgi:SAM-dependent methyltransferase